MSGLNVVQSNFGWTHFLFLKSQTYNEGPASDVAHEQNSAAIRVQSPLPLTASFVNMYARYHLGYLVADKFRARKPPGPRAPRGDLDCPLFTRTADPLPPTHCRPALFESAPTPKRDLCYYVVTRHYSEIEFACSVNERAASVIESFQGYLGAE
ncbi:hypothetical protein J6590_024155 [Homalodisca vitripennis]|nr:hypothetical protein J6590_024155 [Homalodisca vitripennis]